VLKEEEKTIKNTIRVLEAINKQSREGQHPLAVDTAVLFEKPEDGKIAYLKSQKKRRHLQLSNSHFEEPDPRDFNPSPLPNTCYATLVSYQLK